MDLARPLALACLAAACGDPPAREPPPWQPHATAVSAGGPRCTTTTPLELGLAWHPGVRIAANASGSLVAWTQPDITSPEGRAVVQALDYTGRPRGEPRSLVLPNYGRLADLVADDRGFFLLSTSPLGAHQFVLAFDAAGAQVGAPLELRAARGHDLESAGPDGGRGVALLYEPDVARELLWVQLTRDEAGAPQTTTTALATLRTSLAGHTHAWVHGDGPPALVLAYTDAPLELLIGLPGPSGLTNSELRRATEPLAATLLGLDARWRGPDIDLLYATGDVGASQIRRALLRADATLERDPQGLEPFVDAITLAWPDSVTPTRHTRAGRPLTGDAFDIDALDPENYASRVGADWAWTGEQFLLAYPAARSGHFYVRVVGHTCPGCDAPPCR